MNKDVVGQIVGKFSALSPPLDLRYRVGVHVARDVVSCARPDVHAPIMISSEPRLV